MIIPSEHECQKEVPAGLLGHPDVSYGGSESDTPALRHTFRECLMEVRERSPLTSRTPSSDRKFVMTYLFAGGYFYNGDKYRGSVPPDDWETKPMK